MADIRIENHGSIVLLRPLTAEGEQWLNVKVAEDAQTWGKAVICEPRYVANIVEGMQGDGLEVEE